MPMSSSFSLRILSLSILVAAASTPSYPASAVDQPCASFPPKGAWAGDAGAEVLFEPERVILREHGFLRAASVVQHDGCKLIVRDQGLLATWTLSGDGHSLRLDEGKEHLVLSQVPRVPADLNLSPFRLAAPGVLPVERVKEISQELSERAKRDQNALKGPALRAQRPAVLADNLGYLKKVVREVGWIDIPRFGKPAAAAAILIAKHGDDLSLMAAALPMVERDARENGGSGEMLSVLADELLITLGRKQRYGTQIAEDEQGRPFVLPVEDPAKVDEYRKAIGILSWSEYLKLASKNLYNGAPIRLLGPNE
ncbi:MAG: hypothetical protein M3O15_01095 [Acidobacteriota bacterium]|nr:hypothetical protein [Acidobacteriota bacterium]